MHYHARLLTIQQEWFTGQAVYPTAWQDGEYTIPIFHISHQTSYIRHLSVIFRLQRYVVFLRNSLYFRKQNDYRNELLAG